MEAFTYCGVMQPVKLPPPEGQTEIAFIHATKQVVVELVPWAVPAR